MNKITITGRLSADADLRYIASGEAIANFRVASDVGFGDKKTTNWFSCTVFGKRGEALCPMLIKGLPVTVFGTLILREWTTKEGTKQLSPDIRVDEITLHGKKSGDADILQPRQSEKPQQRKPTSSGDDDLVDAPF